MPVASPPTDPVEKSARPRRNRQGDLQRRQKEATRQKLLASAHAVFADNGYATTSVDMIVEEAEVSRTSFYRHFDDKYAVAQALFSELIPEVQDRWRELLAIPRPGLADVVAWVTAYVDLLEVNRVLIGVLREVDAIEVRAQQRVLDYHNDLLAVMAARVPGLGDEGAVPRARALLLLLQVDQFSYAMSIRNWPIERGVMIAAMAALIHEFLVLAEGGG
ncbi:hypothetical protein ACFB49_08220 [Sphingomonas sp. DBB INV C78]|uniref:TetR/AcrR family transcriptional regulator n=1 Tax=Sphingomonas sp. DBB INV C78 TaxID=3349434 RepID=UPI0036D2586D